MVNGEVPPACKTCHDVELAVVEVKDKKDSFIKQMLINLQKKMVQSK